MLSNIKNKNDIVSLFPADTKQIKSLVHTFLEDAKKEIKHILCVDTENRTFENTAHRVDILSCLSDLSVFFGCLNALEMLSPEKDIRETAQEEIIKIQKFWVEEISNNKQLYDVLKIYANTVSNTKETLSDEQKYFLQETLSDYKRAGLDLSEKQLAKIKTLKKELGQLGLQFETNIATDQTKLSFEQSALAGLDPEFLDALEQDSQGHYIIGLDYPTYFTIMDNCRIEETRKKLYIAFNNRAYPVNSDILERIIEKRDTLAKLLGFASYAHLDLDDQMAKTPEHATKFLLSLYEKADKKAAQEFELLAKNIPEGVTLSHSATSTHINPWDLRYIKNYYKKQQFDIDEEKIAEYFPTKETLNKLFEIYEDFFSLEFRKSDIEHLWHKDVTLMEVWGKNSQNTSPNTNISTGADTDTTNTLLGYLLMDLYPRNNKYGHACQMTIVPAVQTHGPSVCIVVANFPKETKEKPSLLKLNDVETFFHELGHALHAILGRTNIASFSGTSVKTDFVEMPSQMLEEWLSDTEILKKISSHYKTKASLPDATIENILKLKHFDTGDFLQRQCFLSCLALTYFGVKNREQKSPKELYDALKKEMRSRLTYCQDDNMYASFGHLSGYGAKYYSYMWSKVYAIDMFEKIIRHSLKATESKKQSLPLRQAQGRASIHPQPQRHRGFLGGSIKKYSLLNPVIGKQYVDQVIGKGASIDPNILLEQFLGRKPNQKAFFENLGISVDT